MNYLKKLALAISLQVVLASVVFAGETNTPPCPNPIPGETNTPPCSTQLVNAESDEANTTVIDLEVFVFEAATYGIESLLTVF